MLQPVTGDIKVTFGNGSTNVLVLYTSFFPPTNALRDIVVTGGTGSDNISVVNVRPRNVVATQAAGDSGADHVFVGTTDPTFPFAGALTYSSLQTIRGSVTINMPEGPTPR